MDLLGTLSELEAVSVALVLHQQAIDTTTPAGRISATLLGHASSSTGEKHYNQARMLDASRRYGMTIFKLRQALLMTPTAERDGSDE